MARSAAEGTSARRRGHIGAAPGAAGGHAPRPARRRQRLPPCSPAVRVADKGAGEHVAEQASHDSHGRGHRVHLQSGRGGSGMAAVQTANRRAAAAAQLGFGACMRWACRTACRLHPRGQKQNTAERRWGCTLRAAAARRRRLRPAQACLLGLTSTGKNLANVEVARAGDMVAGGWRSRQRQTELQLAVAGKAEGGCGWGGRADMRLEPRTS